MFLRVRVQNCGRQPISGSSAPGNNINKKENMRNKTKTLGEGRIYQDYCSLGVRSILLFFFSTLVIRQEVPSRDLTRKTPKHVVHFDFKVADPDDFFSVLRYTLIGWLITITKNKTGKMGQTAPMGDKIKILDNVPSIICEKNENTSTHFVVMKGERLQMHNW